jgi:hypothetical protein
VDEPWYKATTNRRCDRTAQVVSDEELEELFCMIDADGSGGISAEEFGGPRRGLRRRSPPFG